MKVNSMLVVLTVCALAATVFAAEKEANSPPGPAKKTAAPKDANVAPVLLAKPVPSKDANAAPAEPNAPKPTDPNEVAVTINGVNITEGEIDAKLKPHLDRIAKQMAPNMVEPYKKRVRGQAVEGMIVERLLDEKAKQAGIVANDKDVNDKIAEIAAQQNIPVDSFKSLVEAQGQNFEQFKQQMKKGLAYEKLIQREAKGELDVNDAEALAYYEENKEDYNTPEQVQASHILIQTAPTATPEEKAKAKEKAEGLLKQIKDGADFAALAKENSDCPSKARGGDLGFFAKGSMVKPFEDAAFAMQPGQVSDVVETQFGCHIIKTTDRKPAGLAPFDKAKGEIINQLKGKKQGQAYRQYIDKLKAEAKIVYPPGKEPTQLMPPRPVEIAPERKMEVAPAPK